jgi:hypothetical protein
MRSYFQEHEEHYFRTQEMSRYKINRCQTQKWHFRPLKHAFLVPTNHTTITKHI